MTPRPRTAPKLATANRVGSWMALLAVTTLGVDSAESVSAIVKMRAPLPAAAQYRLVVQSYDATEGEIPGKGARPVGSMQRAVTAAELREGVKVNLLELRADAQLQLSSNRPVVVAWIERGEADLEFDGRRARPQPGSVYGVVPRRASQGHVEISLDQRVAA